MRRRILLSVLAVTAVAVTAFLVPAARAIRSRDVDTQELELRRDAALAAVAVDAAHPRGDDLPADGEHDYGLYDGAGRRVAGRGPDRADEPVRSATATGDGFARIDGRMVAALRIGDADEGGPSLVLRVAESAREASSATWRVVSRLGLGAVGILVAAACIAYALADRLVRPLEQLRRSAARLGAGDFAVAVEPTGVAELDDVGRALTDAGARLGAAMARERAFSADASHQLRTPITALRAAIEAEQLAPRPDPGAVLDELLAETDRLEAIVVSLLALARETHADRSAGDLREILAGVERRWAAEAARRGRSLSVDVPGTPVVSSAAPAAIDHVLDVLIDNALRHGRGPVDVRLEPVGTGARVEVRDEGSVVAGAELFERRSAAATGTGIGLGLARRLVEAEGGHLRLASSDPTVFELALPGGPRASADPPPPAPGRER